MSSVTKDTIYVDVDDEITAIIDKVAASKHKLVALVLPKRATMLQSIVNMKLLKRSADNSGKHLVLVTTESGLMPLAGAVGLHVANTPQSKPVLPAAPAGYGAPETEEGTYDFNNFDPKDNATKPIGELAGAAPFDDTIELDNKDIVGPDDVGSKVGATGAGKSAKKAAKKDGNKKPKIPNFNSFRKRLALGAGLVVLLIAGGILAFVVLPKATVALKTDSEDIRKTIDLRLDTKANEVSPEDGVVPATIVSTENTQAQTSQATGQQNNGEKAKGEATLSISPSACGNRVTIPAGTGLSSNGLTYLTQETVQLGRGDRTCTFEEDVDIVASQPGANYNTSSTTFAVAGHSAVSAESNRPIRGGTDNIVKVVSQADIDSAKQKLASATNDAAKEELRDKLNDQGLYPVTDSFNAGDPEIAVSAKVGDRVDSVTVTQKTTYTMAGADKEDLNELITQLAEEDIDTNKQKVLNTGLDNAVFKLQSQTADTVLMSMETTALAGPELDNEALKEQIRGKKANEAEGILKQYPGVTDVEVSYSPFWVSSIPKSADKINLVYEK